MMSTIGNKMTGKMRAGLAVCAAAAGLLMGFGEKAAHADPGVDTDGVGNSNVEFGSLAPVVTESGFVTYSFDGMGTLSNTGTIRANKPAGATVRRAFLGSATTGFTNYKEANGDVSIDGTPISWDISTTSSISSWNHWAEVTSVVKAKIDAAATGIVPFTITEKNTSLIDGEVLAVIFDDPAQTTVNTVILLFGAQKVGGDTFAIQLSDPLNLSDPKLALDLSLGISYSYEFGGAQQYSIVKVDGTQMTTSAGGEDDGASANGALITVGGIGDTNADPNPTALPTNARSDDELYSLLPFVKTGDTSISVFSVNPSNDDNIFFAGLFVGDAAAIVGEGIVIGPGSETAVVGSTTSVVATVQNANNQPVANTAVTFTVTAGPNAGQTFTGTTDATGKVTFSYVGSGGIGTDEVSATFVDQSNHTVTSNTVIRNWTTTTKPSCALTSVIAGPPKQLQITVAAVGGLQSVAVTESNNATVAVPPFPLGDTSPVIVMATKTDQTQGATVALTITDVSGNVTTCDPVVPGDPLPTAGNVLAAPSADQGGCNLGAASSRSTTDTAVSVAGLLGLALLRRRRPRRGDAR